MRIPNSLRLIPYHKARHDCIGILLFLWRARDAKPKWKNIREIRVIMRIIKG